MVIQTQFLSMANFGYYYQDIDEAGEIYALMGPHLYPDITISLIIMYGLAATFIAALASLIPARRAVKRESAEALHYV